MTVGGLKKIVPDHRDLSHTRTFGAINPQTFPEEFNVDAGLTNPNQNAEGLPYGCTGYTQAELCTDEDKLIYKPRYTYEKTCFMEGHGDDEGCDIRTSLKSLRVYGPQEQGESTDQEAFKHIRGKYYSVEPAPDYFDGVRSMLIKAGPVSIGTPWYPSFDQTINGIVQTPVSWNDTGLGYHNWKICGWKTVNGVAYLVGKVWLGQSWGINGYGLFKREDVNMMLGMRYTGAYVIDKEVGDPKNVILSIDEVLLSYYYRIFNILVGNYGKLVGATRYMAGEFLSAARV